MSLKVYCYSGCGTCKKALKYFELKGVDVQVVPIRETPPTKTELRKMLQYQDGNIKKLFNTSSKDYKQGGYKDKLPKMTAGEAIDVLNATGNLVKRPFILGETFGLVGFNVEYWDEVLFQE
ncbi:MAG: Spx/MgsR family RNA polymerase-binding regulatory protein [Deltaproteobacteria bacterium]|nr:Spx/MgsR family RNA polymerase-binding regulatory protein [Deltaproteobacteria bacterium]MBN2670585.1 Spx/MgsR family RNA polymerase-binding regulatory protein [Deltaproteobacteria bacterium]